MSSAPKPNVPPAPPASSASSNLGWPSCSVRAASSGDAALRLRLPFAPQPEASFCHLGLERTAHRPSIRSPGRLFVAWFGKVRHFGPSGCGVNHEKQSRSKRSTRSQLCSFKPLPGNPQPDRQKCQNEEGRLTKIVLGLRLAVLIIASRGAPWLLAGVCALHRSRLCEIGSVCQVCGQPRVRFSLFR